MIVPGRLLAPANALEVTSFNAALILGPALAGGLSVAVDPAAPLLVEIVLTLAAAAIRHRRGIANGPGLTATFATRQRHVPPELHGQVFTTAVGLKVGSLALGSALSGPVVLAIGADGALFAAAGMQFVAVAAGLALGAGLVP